MKRHILAGALAGLVVGLVVGALSEGGTYHTTDSLEGADDGLVIAGYGLVGAVLGGVVGHSVTSDRWEISCRLSPSD